MATEFRFDVDVRSLEVKFLDSSQQGFPDLLQLLGDDGEHLDEDTVELIEACPAALLGEASEVTLHHLVIDLV